MSRVYVSQIARLLAEHKISEQKANMKESSMWCPIADDQIRKLFPKRVAEEGIDAVAQSLTDRDLVDLHAEVQRQLVKKKATLRYLEQEGKGNRADAQQLREEIKQMEAAQEQH